MAVGFGPVTYPRRYINPLFRDAVRLSMRNAFRASRELARGEIPTCRGLSGTVLTMVCGFPTQSELSRNISAERVGASPRMIARLEALAKAVGFVGDVFCDGPTVEHDAAEQGARL